MDGSDVTALVPVPPREQTALTAYEPRSLDEAIKIAQWFAKSGILGKFQTPEQVFLIMATGAELGIPATAALRGIFAVEGRPYISADLKMALCLQRPQTCEYFELVDTSEEKATYRTKRVGRAEHFHTYTIEDAERAGLLKPSRSGEATNWQKRPAVMLRHRCSSELANIVYPEIVLGLPTLDEAEEVVRNQQPMVLDAETVPTPATGTKSASETIAQKVDRIAKVFESVKTGADQEAFDAAAREAGDFKKNSPERARLAALYAPAKARMDAWRESQAEQPPEDRQPNGGAELPAREPGSDDQ